MTPVAFFYCDSPSCASGNACAGSKTSNGCQVAYGVFENTDGSTRIVEYEVNTSIFSSSSVLSITGYKDVTETEDPNNLGTYFAPIDAYCKGGKVVIVTTAGLYAEVCGLYTLVPQSSEVTITTTNVIAGDDNAVLYGQNGVAYKYSGKLSGLIPNDLSVPQQVAIATDGTNVLTVGEGDNANSGVSFQVYNTQSAQSASGYAVIGTGLGTQDAISGDILGNTIAILYQAGANAVLALSFDGGVTFETVRTWAGVTVTLADVKFTDEGWLYVVLNGRLYFSVNYGCVVDDDCTLNDTGVNTDLIAVCENNSMIAVGYDIP